MVFEFSIRSVRELKGAPLSIVVALSIAHMRVSQQWLIAATNYTDKTIATALTYLEEAGIVCRYADGWQLAQAQQLALPMDDGEGDALEDGDAPQESQEEEGTRGASLLLDGEFIGAESSDTENFSDSGAVVVVNHDLRAKGQIKSNNNSPPIRKNSDSGFAEVDRALKSAGVMGKTRQELAARGDLTVETVERWAAEIAGRDGVRNRVGMLVQMLRSGEVPPVRLSDEQRRQSYAKWDTSGER